MLVSALPRVEDPIPETIGFGSIVFAAGAGGVVAGVVYARSPAAQRDEAVRKGGLWGFWIGLLLYLLALFAQVGFGL